MVDHVGQPVRRGFTGEVVDAPLGAAQLPALREVGLGAEPLHFDLVAGRLCDRVERGDEPAEKRGLIRFIAKRSQGRGHVAQGRADLHQPIERERDRLHGRAFSAAGRGLAGGFFADGVVLLERPREPAERCVSCLFFG